MTKKEQKRYEYFFGDRKLYELTEEEIQAPITKEIGETCRHRLEMRWYRRLVEINLLIIIVVIMSLIFNFKKNFHFFAECGSLLIEDISTTWQELMEESEEQSEESEFDWGIWSFLKEDDQVSERADRAEGYEDSYEDDVEEDKDKKTDSDDDEEKETASDKLSKKLEEDMPVEISLFFYGILVLAFGFVGLYFYYAMYRSMSLRITEKNFPEVYHTIEEYSKRLGIKTPKAYVMGSDGVLNAFSTFLFKRQWILINAELFEVAYREYHDMDSLNFIIAHEMAHIYYGHSTLHYNLPIWFSMNVPIIGAIASRAREYSCDRLAQRLTGVSGIDAMLVLVVDRHLYKMVDKEDYLNEMRNMKGFFIWLVNMLVDHPIMCKRMIALEEGRGSGKLY